MNAAMVIFVLAGCVVLAGLLASVIVGMAPASPELALAVAAHLDNSGVTHPVTAVLLNFRAYDTLLEVAVMLLAPVIALMLPLPPGAVVAHAPRDPVLHALTRAALPLALLVAVFLLLVGATRSGGAFQAAAVLAGAGVLLGLTWNLSPLALTGRCGGRALLALGLAVFLAVGVLGAWLGSGFLGYPPELAGVLILVVETALMLSIAFALWALFP